jgi:hypothetical protein
MCTTGLSGHFEPAVHGTVDQFKMIIRGAGRGAKLQILLRRGFAGGVGSLPRHRPAGPGGLETTRSTSNGLRSGFRVPTRTRCAHAASMATRHMKLEGTELIPCDDNRPTIPYTHSATGHLENESLLRETPYPTSIPSSTPLSRARRNSRYPTAMPSSDADR